MTGTALHRPVTSLPFPSGPGPHGGTNGNDTVGAVEGILLVVVLLGAAIWAAHTWWSRRRKAK